MSKKVSFCMCNEGYEKLMEKVKEISGNHIVTENKCIGVCNLCGYKYIVRVDGKLIESEDLMKAYNLIKKALEN
jgi:uncharacterized protein YuzB (UPF0349 family)